MWSEQRGAMTLKSGMGRERKRVDVRLWLEEEKKLSDWLKLDWIQGGYYIESEIKRKEN